MSSRQRPGARDAVAIAAARLAVAGTRVAGRAGTSLPGLVASRVSPGFDARLVRQAATTAFISGTNGKTTTSHLLAGLLRAAGRSVVANPSGANLRQGISAALAAAASVRGGLRDPGTSAVLEVDEMALPGLVAARPDAALVLTNLSRDQLDRFGETDLLVRRWTAMLADSRVSGPVIYSVDDPQLEAMVAATSLPRVGIGMGSGWSRDESAALTPEPGGCPRCRATSTSGWTAGGQLGLFHCGMCGFGRREPDIALDVLETRGLDGQTIRLRWRDGLSETVRLGLPGLGNARNAIAAVAAAGALGVDRHQAARALEGIRPPFGRFERVELDDRLVVLALLKNPAGLQELTSVAAGSRIDTVLLALNDAHADGRDVSWYWDGMPTALLAGRQVVLGGRRAADFALRLMYARDQPSDRVQPGLLGLVRDPAASLERAVRATPRGGIVLAAATYTALLALRSTLVGRALVPAMPT